MIEFRRYTLPNGLRVIHNFDPATSMAAVNVLYNTGSRDEREDLTGIAHLFEHLMFGGSVNVPDFDLELGDAGGSSNAWTSNDFTNFYDILPAANIETALHLESDRMLSLAFNPKSLEIQRNVVTEEFKQQCLNAPYGDLMHYLRPAIYGHAHPYSWPVIGKKPEHVAGVTDADIRQWFYTHYAPNNAVLAIAGNIPYNEGRRLIEKWFNDIPSRPIPPRILPEPDFPDQDINLSVKGNAPVPAIVIAIPMDPYGTHDYRVADCITDILSAGRSSRIFRDIVAGGDGSVIAADASIIGSEHPGFMMFTAKMSDDSTSTAESTAKRLCEQLESLAGLRPVEDHELERTLNRFESTFALGNLDNASKAFNLALSEMHGENINDTVARQRLITKDDISRVAAILSTRPKIILHYHS